MTQISPATGFELIRRLVHGAVEAGADMIVTVCPMCQMNIDAFQAEMNRYFKTSYHMPILFFTQMIGLAFGYRPRSWASARSWSAPARRWPRSGSMVPEPEAQVPGAPRRTRRPRREDGPARCRRCRREDGEAPQ